MKLNRRNNLVQKRRWRIRKKIKGTADRPRLSVCFTNKHIYAQCINDVQGKTLCALSTTSKEMKDQKQLPNMKGAEEAGKLFGDKAKAAGLSQVVFDRGPRRFHGAVKAFADAARQSGLQF